MKSNILKLTAVFAFTLFIGVPASYAKVKSCKGSIDPKTPCILDASKGTVYYASSGNCTIKATSSGALYTAAKCSNCETDGPFQLSEGATVLVPQKNKWGVRDGFRDGYVTAFRGTFIVVSCAY